MLKGILFALLGGACITLQGVANNRISYDIGTWQAATITQLTGFILAGIVLAFVRDGSWKSMRQVPALYWFGGAFASVIIFSEVTAIQYIGVTFTIAMLLIAQLCMTFVIDSRGWFGVLRRHITVPQCIGVFLMIAGVLILKL